MTKKQKRIVATSVLISFTLLIIFSVIIGVYDIINVYKIRRQYRIDVATEFSIDDNLRSVDGETAHVIFLAGQSNATGSSANSYLQQNVTAEKYQEYLSGYDNVFINYLNENGITKSGGFINAKIGCGFSSEMFGPELGIAEKLHENFPDKTFFIIKYSYGATMLDTHWLAPSSTGKTGKLYTAFINFAKSNIDYIKTKGYNIELNGMCWMQGESDAVFKSLAKLYKTNAKNFIKDIRNDLKDFGGENLLFIDALIDDYAWEYHETVNNAKLKVGKLSDNNVVIDTQANGLTTKNEPSDNPDIYHYDSLSELKLGNLFAEEILKRLS